MRIKEAAIGITGRSVSLGMGRGSVYRYQHTQFSSNGRFRGGHISEDFHYIEKADVAEELIRCHFVFSEATCEIDELVDYAEANLSHELYEAFAAHASCLHDPSLLGEIDRTIREDFVSTASALLRVFPVRAQLPELRFDERYDIAHCLLQHLSDPESREFNRIPRRSVVTAVSLLPSEMLRVIREGPEAVIVEHLPDNSLAALILRESGVPCVECMTGTVDTIPEGAGVLVDADAGHILFERNVTHIPSFRSVSTKEQVR